MTAWKKLKNYFIAGLIAILPLWITYIILRLVFSLTASVAKPIFRNMPVLTDKPLLLDIASFVGTITIVIFFGILLTNVLGRRVFLTMESLFNRIPLLSWIYISIRKLTGLFYDELGESRFKRVVMFEYPRKGSFSIGFMTTEAVEAINAKAGRPLVNVFLPTTPNPTSGYLLMLPKEDVIPLDISTEDAVKLIVSGGISTPSGID